MTQKLNNRYRVIKALSSGGFGETFLAEDNQMPSGRKCVIKQLKPVIGNSKNYQLIQERFQREAAILETLGESNSQIPKLYAYFSESNNFFLVQEWIQGRTIADVVEQSGPLKENAVKKILISILQTLEQIHSKGIIHRDIKPENIIIREQDCQPVLIDFGAVKETMGVQAASNSRTQSIVIGTFGFMPPEQTAGRPVFSSDLYSLGLTAIYMLTGKNPSELEINLQTGEIDWQKYAPGISPAIILVIERSIQPTAENRYATATEMLAACNTASNKQKSNRIRSAAANTTTVLAKSTRGQINRPLKLVSWLKTAAISSLVVGVPIGLLSNLNFFKSLRPNEVSSKSSASSSSSTSSSTSVNYSTSNRENTDTSSNTSDADKQRNLEKLLKTKECRNCDLSGVNLSGANLSNAELYDANLSGAVLSRANLYHAKLRNSSLADAKLDNANLYQANLSNADLEKADLTKANLAQAELENTNLGNANLSNAFLVGGRLISTNLIEANLSNANLKDTNLKQANFSKARLDGANLTGAALCSYKKSNCANLDGASLNQVIGLEQN